MVTFISRRVREKEETIMLGKKRENVSIVEKIYE